MFAKLSFVLVSSVVEGLLVVSISCFEVIGCDAYVGLRLAVVGCRHFCLVYHALL